MNVSHELFRELCLLATSGNPSPFSADLYLHVMAEVARMNRRCFLQRAEVVSRTIPMCADAEFGGRALQRSFRRTVSTDASAVNHPLEVFRFLCQVSHDRFIIPMLPLKAVRDRMPNRPEKRREMAFVRCAQTSRLV